MSDSGIKTIFQPFKSLFFLLIERVGILRSISPDGAQSYMFIEWLLISVRIFRIVEN